MNIARVALGLFAAFLLGGCAGGAGSPNQLVVTNDSAGAIEAMVWAGDALPPDPQTPVKMEAAITNSIGAGQIWRVDLPERSAASQSASSTVATLAVRAQGEDIALSKWIDVEGVRPWVVRVFGESPNLRVARVIQQPDDGRMQRAIGPRPPSVGSTGGFGSGPQR